MSTLTLFHGSDKMIETPLFGYGKTDNDYGSGFYTTLDEEKAIEWATANGKEGKAYVNIYKIKTDNMNIARLDDYGVLSWLAEITYNRGQRSENATILADKIIDKYRPDLSKADIIVGYRADSSYLDIVDSFLENQININEVERLFKKGNLGMQYFIKSEKAFDTISFDSAYAVKGNNYQNLTESKARIDVSNFLNKRRNQIFVEGYTPQGILARDVAKNFYKYDKELNFYEITNNFVNKESNICQRY